MKNTDRLMHIVGRSLSRLAGGLVVLTVIVSCSNNQALTGKKDFFHQLVADLHQHTRILASDEFEGRAPATQGEEKTVNYLRDQFIRLKIPAANEGSYFQEVPIVEITSKATPLTVKSKGKDFSFAYSSEMMATTQRLDDIVALNNSDIVFVGYGINAPERNWNDYAGIDVKGKTVIILVNDPGFTTQNPDHFNGNAMTYYGRWTYKYEEAANQGAAAAFIVHETAPAAYPWEVVSNSWSGAQVHLKGSKGYKLAVEGWLHIKAAKALLSAAGKDYDQLKMQAAKTGFKPFSMNMQASMGMKNNTRFEQSRNVLGMIEGTKHADEYVIYTAHWDHLGKDSTREGDQIFNGAIDNATGTSGLLALAKIFAQQPPKRSIVFLAVTAEESGLLGSKYYAENPIFPLEKTVAVINMDALNAIGKVNDLVVIGYGFNQLQDYLSKLAQTQERRIVPDQNAEKGYYFRSDHFSMARLGVPAIYAEGGTDSIKHGQQWGENRLEEYTRERYHKPQDEYHSSMNLEGAAQDVELYYLLGNELANSRDWPEWNKGSEFRRIRQQSKSARL